MSSEMMPVDDAPDAQQPDDVLVSHVRDETLMTTFWREVEEQWDLIQENLIKCGLSSEIQAHDEQLGDSKFDALHNYSENESEVFQEVTPKIIKLALSLRELVTEPLPLLKQGIERELTLTQRQIAAILANAFLCALPARDSRPKLPSINFDQLFRFDSPRKQEKLKCIFNYFDRVGNQCSDNLVTFKRLVVRDDKMPKWWNSEKQLCKLDVSSTGTIEESGAETIQVDFANRLIGGGVLGKGLVQEEIRFVINPELIVSRLFVEELQDNEALLVIGSECYSKFSGYSDSFRYEGNHVDKTSLEENTTPLVNKSGGRRRKCAIVAIDATRFNRREISPQLHPVSLLRETNKAYVGFLADGFNSSASVATGNWGCGAFNGDPRLKALLQIMAATEAGRSLMYFTFDDDKLTGDIKAMHALLVEKKVTVGKLYQKITAYKLNRRENLYQMLSRNFNGKKLSDPNDRNPEVSGQAALHTSEKKSFSLKSDSTEASSSAGNDMSVNEDINQTTRGIENLTATDTNDESKNSSSHPKKDAGKGDSSDSSKEAEEQMVVVPGNVRMEVRTGNEDASTEANDSEGVKKALDSETTHFESMKVTSNTDTNDLEVNDIKMADDSSFNSTKSEDLGCNNSTAKDNLQLSLSVETPMDQD